MHVHIVPTERPRVLFFLFAPKCVVLAKVEFDPVERAVIDRYQLYDHIVIKRPPLIVWETVTVNECDRSYQRKEKREVDQNIRLRHFYGRTVEFPVENPAAGRALADELHQALVDLKKYLEANGSHGEPTTFDL